MGVRKTVFASKSERRNFEHIARNWGDRYRAYPNLPFLSVFDVSNLVDPKTHKVFNIGHIDFARLKKTSIDYTLCDEHDVPLVCVEFDGMQEGFNVGTKYHTFLLSDPWRELITDLKLKVAYGSKFPFFVVGSPQFEQISTSSHLAIVDGIIGDALASKAVSERVARGFKPEDAGMTNNAFTAMSPAQQHEVIQDWLFGTEVEADFAHNPIYRACAALQEELHVHEFSVEHLTCPDANRAKDIWERVKMIEEAILEGSMVTVKHPKAGSSTSTVMLPNFKTAGMSPISLSQELAQLVALDGLKQKLNAP